MGKELPWGLVEKRLSWERYLGSESRIAIEAFRIYLERKTKNLPGTAELDWLMAEENVRNELTNELLGEPTP